MQDQVVERFASLRYAGAAVVTVRISRELAAVKLTRKDLQEKLRQGTPSIEVMSMAENSIND